MGNSTSSPGSTTYIDQQNRYWSLQRFNAQTVCRVAPTDAKQVAAAVLIKSFLGCPFAVKSGGHAAFRGASNIEAGVTIEEANA